ncbi:hypothetical protein C0145_06465 [Moraxella catarrhalis]|uniref:MazG-like family protein n=1 Tax=Moraxella catarrhalis TaxID=480 RepID=UPI000202AFDD|nr:MazG-like family protein [Moraxella catarrhalis]ARE65429.1 hypothetical protein MC195_01135 [Moraxella catarrhalis]EGE13204.1 hypothetical protein E9K_06511 [Moraxella catarrhalis 103P14B1]MPW54129.1 hypothetical protein [Moraxella catarrhalis]MPX54938.1 hypothetical protein [Moraxella catarrhalis]
MKEIIEKITKWAEDRNLIKGSTPIKQGLKLMSEYGELCDAVAKHDLEEIKDAIGDIGVVMCIISEQYNHSTAEDASIGARKTSELDYSVVALADVLSGVVLNDRLAIDGWFLLTSIAQAFDFSLEQCLEHAYNEIKDRRGVMFDGVFIKDTDSSYQQALAEVQR